MSAKQKIQTLSFGPGLLQDAQMLLAEHESLIWRIFAMKHLHALQNACNEQLRRMQEHLYQEEEV